MQVQDRWQDRWNESGGGLSPRRVSHSPHASAVATPLGFLGGSPYNAILAYVPSGTSGRVSGGDQILVSASVCGPDDLLQTFVRQTTGRVLLHLLSLG